MRVTGACAVAYHRAWRHFPKSLCEVVSMPEPVRCDVCGKLYSSRHVSSHKRLAHAKPKPGSISEEDQMKTIFEFYKRLSAGYKNRLFARLPAEERQHSRSHG